MENASKALLIAGAILIAIVLISLGVWALGQGSDMVKKNNMSASEIETYNSQFNADVGKNVRGSNIIQLIRKVNSHNKANKGDISRQVNLQVGENFPADLENAKDLEGDDVSATSESAVKSGYTYEVKVGYSVAGLINRIYAVKNK